MITPGQWNERVDLQRRLNSAPLRPRDISPVNPRSTQGWSFYNQLANMGNAGQQSAMQEQAQQANRFGVENLSAAPIAANNYGGTGSRVLNALQGATSRLAGLQGVTQQGGNRLLDILRNKQATQLGAYGTLGDMEKNYANRRLAAGQQAYEQDINRYAATVAAKAQLGI